MHTSTHTEVISQNQCCWMGSGDIYNIIEYNDIVDKHMLMLQYNTVIYCDIQ